MRDGFWRPLLRVPATLGEFCRQLKTNSSKQIVSYVIQHEITQFNHYYHFKFNLFKTSCQALGCMEDGHKCFFSPTSPVDGTRCGDRHVSIL